jgi:predicted ArsR family transcriptional regulator
MTQANQPQAGRTSRVADLAAVVSHPTRRRCWSALMGGQVMSPKQMADEFGMATHHVSYHVSALERLGVIELVHTRPVRGATEHFYRLVERYELSEDEVEALGPEASADHLTLIYQLEFADAAASLDSGKMVERTDHAAWRQPLVLDEEGWRAIASLMQETIDRIVELQVEAVERTKEDPEARSVQAVAHLNFFEMPDRADRLKQF